MTNKKTEENNANDKDEVMTIGNNDKLVSQKHSKLPDYLKGSQPMEYRVKGDTMFQETESMTADDVQLQMPVTTRVRDRMKELTELKRGRNKKMVIGGQTRWKSTPPKMRIENLRGGVRNGVGEISYYVMKVDQKGDKVMGSVSTQRNNKGEDVPVLGQYLQEAHVVEIIREREKIQAEIYPAGAAQ